MALSVMYLHGLESGPNAGKARRLREAGEGRRFAVTAPALPTDGVIEARGVSPEALDRAMAPAVAAARAAYLAARPDVVVGSSFGGAVLLHLVHDPVWRPESAALFLAHAGLKLTRHRALPGGLRAVIAHGVHDAVIDFDDARNLAATQPDAVLVALNDDHRLSASMARGLIESLVELAHSLALVAP
ncbi:MAG: hypothetical protein JNK72_20095 [Myxococcales bacterium]|nr:hypothetical protein [Myxococcales bacterium]